MREVTEIVSDAKSLAYAYRRATGRTLGLTGEIGDIEAATKLGLSLVGSGATHDATDESRARLRIETLQVDPDTDGRAVCLPTLADGSGFDAMLLVLLDERYDAIEIWRAERAAVLSALADPQVRIAHGGCLSVARFQTIGRLVWSDAGAWVRPARTYGLDGRKRT